MTKMIKKQKQIIITALIGTTLVWGMAVLLSLVNIAAVGEPMPITGWIHQPWEAALELTFGWVAVAHGTDILWKEVRKELTEINE